MLSSVRTSISNSRLLVRRQCSVLFRRMAAQPKVPVIIRKIIDTPNAPAAIGPYSQAVQVDTTLYLSGQIGLDPKTGEFVSDKTDEQATQALKNLGAVLEAAGTSFNNVVRTTVLFADLNDFESVNAIYATYFVEKQPARAAFQASQLPKGAKVEIEAVAVVGEVIDVK